MKFTTLLFIRCLYADLKQEIALKSNETREAFDLYQQISSCVSGYLVPVTELGIQFPLVYI